MVMGNPRKSHQARERTIRCSFTPVREQEDAKEQRRRSLQKSLQAGLWKSCRLDPLDYRNRLRQLFQQKRTDRGTLRLRSLKRIPGPTLMTLRQGLQDF